MAVRDLRDMSTGECTIGENGHRNYTRIIRVWFDNPFEAGITAILASGIEYAQIYQHGAELDSYSRCRSIQANKVDDYIYDVTAEYTTDYKGEGYENPTDEPPQISWDFAGEVEEAIYKDVLTGKGFVNSAGKPFQEQPSRRKAKQSVTITTREKNDPMDYAYQFNFKMNDATVQIGTQTFGAETVLCTGITSVPKWAMVQGSRIQYFERTVKFEIDNEDNHKGKILQQGFEYLEGGTLKKFKTDDDEEVQEPRLLKANGDKLPQGDDPVFKDYNRYYTRDFSMLGDLST